MARARYVQNVRIGDVDVPVQRTENMCEDWTWRTVKLSGFIFGAISFLFLLFCLGSLWGGRNSTPPTTTATTITTTTPSGPVGGGGGSSSSKTVKITPPTLSTTTIKVAVDPIKIEVAQPPPPPVPIKTKPKLRRAW